MAEGRISPTASEFADSDDDLEWEYDLNHASIYYLNPDQAQNSWPRSRPRLPSLLSNLRPAPASATDEHRRSTDTGFEFVSSNPEAEDDEDAADDEEENEILFDWVTYFDRPQQEDYTWEQLHPNAAAALNLPIVRRAQEIREDFTERAQPYVNTVVETYNDAAVRVEGAARVANELAIVTGQVSSWLAGEAWQRVEALPQVLQTQLPVLQARIEPLLPVVANWDQEVAVNPLRRAANTVWQSLTFVGEGLREGWRAVAPLENHSPLVQGRRRR